MKSSQAFFVSGVLLFITMVAGAAGVGAKNDGGRTGVKATSDHAYLPLIARPVDPATRERDALVALYQSTNGEGWTESRGWLGPDDHCYWYRVVCDTEGVKRLTLDGNQLSGYIPPELGNVDALEVLFLGENQLQGTIPRELGNLTSLRNLKLANNQLGGPIPPELANPPRLAGLNLSANELDGPIPRELGSLRALAFLVLSENKLHGQIPPELGHFKYLRSLFLDNNQLSGPVPKELSHLTRLLQLSLANNQLSCWETQVVLQWALSLSYGVWEDPPGTTICQAAEAAVMAFR